MLCEIRSFLNRGEHSLKVSGNVISQTSQEDAPDTSIRSMITDHSFAYFSFMEKAKKLPIFGDFTGDNSLLGKAQSALDVRRHFHQNKELMDHYGSFQNFETAVINGDDLSWMDQPEPIPEPGPVEPQAAPARQEAEGQAAASARIST